MPIRILHTNDMHGTHPRHLLEPIRRECDLYFDSGDVIKTGNLGIPLRAEPAWEELEELRCTASVLGNRETHVLESAFKAKLAGARHPILCGNLRRKNGTRPFPGTLELECEGYRVGIVGVMVPMVTERMKTKAASAFLWDAPIPTAAELGEGLRPRVDLLIALTHIGHRQDRELAERAPFFDAILGGHSHTLLREPERVGRTAICQAGSHLRYVGLYRWSPEEGFTGQAQALG